MFVPEDDVISGATDVISFLRNVSYAVIEAKRKRIARLLPCLVYRNVALTVRSKADLAVSAYQGKLLGWTGAYEVAINAALKKIRNRLKASRERLDTQMVTELNRNEATSAAGFWSLSFGGPKQ